MWKGVRTRLNRDLLLVDDDDELEDDDCTLEDDANEEDVLGFVPIFLHLQKPNNNWFLFRIFFLYCFSIEPITQFKINLKDISVSHYGRLY